MRESRIAYIDGLRGVAVLAVFANHLAWGIPAIHNSWTHAYLSAGRHGVELFFVLSGFCLSYPAILAFHTTGATAFDIVAYGARRLVRIVPPYYAAIVACSLILFAGRLNPNYHVTAADFLRQAFFIDNGTTWVNPSFWTLAVEFRWYFLMPLALWLWLRFPRIFGVLLLVLPLLCATKIESIDLLLLPAFLLGIVAADVAVRGSNWVRFAPLGIVVFAQIGFSTDQHDGVGAFTWAWILAAFCLVLSAAQIRALRAACSWRWLTAVGVASYSIYLVHQPLVLLFRHLPLAAVITLPILGGFVFWWIAERPWVESPLRGRAVGAIQERLAAYARWLAFPQTVVSLHRKQTQPRELVA